MKKKELETYFAYQLELNAVNIPDKLAVVDLDGTKYTWKQYADDVTRVSNSLLSLGFKKSDKIATIMLNGYDYHCIFMAAATIRLEIVGLAIYGC
jgi:acyl-CoA synthetase (AMP-forming)/AMP-acid ligase II